MCSVYSLHTAYSVKKCAFILLQVIAMARVQQGEAGMVELLARVLAMESAVLHPYQGHLLNRRLNCTALYCLHCTPSQIQHTNTQIHK